MYYLLQSLKGVTCLLDSSPIEGEAVNSWLHPTDAL